MKYKIDVVSGNGEIVIRKAMEERETAMSEYARLMTSVVDDILAEMPYACVFVELYAQADSEWALIRKDIAIGSTV